MIKKKSMEDNKMTESEIKFRDTTIRNFFDKEGPSKIDSRSKEEKTSIVRVFN